MDRKENIKKTKRRNEKEHRKQMKKKKMFQYGYRGTVFIYLGDWHTKVDMY